MSITLTPEQETWIKAHVATGDFASVDGTVRQLIDDRIAELAHDEEHDDMAWAKPLVDEGLAAFERGEFITLEEHRARNAARRAAFGNSGVRRHHRTGGRQFHRDYPDLTAKAGELVADRYGADFDALYLRLAAFPKSGSPRPKLGRFVRAGLFASWRRPKRPNIG